LCAKIIKAKGYYVLIENMWLSNQEKLSENCVCFYIFSGKTKKNNFFMWLCWGVFCVLVR